MRRLVLVSVWLVFVFLLLELAGFVFYQLQVSRPVSGYGYPAGLIVSHPLLGYVYQPSYSGYFKGTAYQDIPIEINAQGFRDADFTARIGDGERIAVLGDSVVLGAGVRQQDRFTECLSAAADLRLDRGWRVLNLGVHSYTLGHYVTLAGLDFLGAAPDAVLVGITLNDFERMDASGPARRMRRYQTELHTPTWLRRIGDRIGRTYAMRFVQELENRFSYAMLNADEREAYHTKWMRSVVKGWQSDDNEQFFAERLDALTQRLEQAALPFGFILFPERNALLNPNQFDAPRQLVRGLLEQRGLSFCDPYDEFARHSDISALFLDRDSIHYSPRGHQVLCAAVGRCLEDAELAGLTAMGSG